MNYCLYTLIMESICEKYELKWDISMPSKKYVRATVEMVRSLPVENGRDLKTEEVTQRATPTRVQTGTRCHQGIECDMKIKISTAHWYSVVGQRIDILTEVALMSQYKDNPPTRGPPGRALPISLPMENPLKRMVFDPAIPQVDENESRLDPDLMEFYGDIVEDDPIHQHPLGLPVKSNMFVDADRAGK